MTIQHRIRLVMVLATVCCLTAGQAHAIVYDIDTNSPGGPSAPALLFDSNLDSLTNSTNKPIWNHTNDLEFRNGSNLSGVDFTALGITTWARAPRIANMNMAGVNLSGITIDANANSVFQGATAVNADFSNSTFQMNNHWTALFNGADVSGSDFSGASFDWGRDLPVSLFIDATPTNADFSNTTWAIEIDTLAHNADDWFSGGSGAIDAVTAANAMTMEGATITFSGAGVANGPDYAADLIANLGGVDAGTNFGAFYDDAFLNNNFSAFGYGSAAQLDTALNDAGWQNVTAASEVPEPSSILLWTALAGLGCAGIAFRRRKRS